MHSFNTLLAYLATLTSNTLATVIASELPLTVLAPPILLQRRTGELLAIAL